jgi:transposase InsO family protein
MHRDRGSEYTSVEFHTGIRGLGMRQSMGRVGSCYENAAAESLERCTAVKQRAGGPSVPALASFGVSSGRPWSFP